ncbi:MAG: diguanylate cyclase, partial [Pseudomonadota bacterium]|nr:diguanylate cyclase [Pseudomonadota bacterium]
RIGGEEFLICLKNLDLVQAYAVLERLRIEVENVVVILPEGEIVRATLSFGLAQADFDVDLDHLIDLADKALYRAKESGRNKVIVMEMGETLLEQEDLTNASTG